MELYARILKLINEATLKKIQDKNIVIVGIGGVGGFALEALTRFGIKNITIIDNDTVDISNLNRQIISSHEVLEQNKTDVAKRRMLSINPTGNYITYNVFLNQDNLEEYISKDTDFILDCCDTVTTKMALIKYAKYHNIPIICAMGTGNRLDPTKLIVTDIYKTNNDPLAKIMRKLCKDSKIKKLDVVTSIELPIKTHDRTPGSTPFVPSVAGIYMASFIVNKWLKEENKLNKKEININ